ncbi:MAG TPA: tRNA glutamyl-Q(34) synthetase GluQRS [Burkholderiales bacterium]|nr:tRNA glutamyl-Q(34) synthetase GluQRS [Burkholderiales bacterium]
MYTGRFAPSPTGPLHLGSLIAAAASWLDARAAGGRWLVRIEDLDRPRCLPGAADAILRALDRLGLHWDGEVLYQSQRLEHYRAALDTLAPRTYWCGCTRREIADSSLGLASDGAHIYPGTCRGGTAHKRALRVQTSSQTLAFVDRLQGRCEQVLARDIGDFVLYRADGLFAYQLAVVVDDAAQGVTDVVRGADLLDSTPRQIYLQQLLALPTPRYLHVPVALDAAGEKLSKQTAAAPIEADPRPLRRALAFLGQPEAATLEEALQAWNPQLISHRRAMALAP